MKEELFDVYNEAGERIGSAPRRECHGNPNLIHRTAHVVVSHSDGDRILLQKRSMDKDIQPGKWDTAVGGHLQLGESASVAARREMAEELGVTPDASLEYLFSSKIRNTVESENVAVYGVVCDGPFVFQKEEIDEIRFWSYAQLHDPENHAQFTPNLVREIRQLDQYRAAQERRKHNPFLGWGVQAVLLRIVSGALLGALLVAAACFFIYAGERQSGSEEAMKTIESVWHWGIRFFPAALAVIGVFFAETQGRNRNEQDGE